MKVLVDTSALLAILDVGDRNHERAVAMLKASLQRYDLFTHNYIHVEAERLVRRHLGAEAAARLTVELLPALRTEWIDEALHARAMTALRTKGRAASLVDEVSVALMHDEGARVALAFDTGFEAEGFSRPPLPEQRAQHRSSEAATSYGGAAGSEELVSVREIAERSGRSVNTIQSWRRRHADFPARHTDLATGPIWLWRDVERWISRRHSPRRGANAE